VIDGRLQRLPHAHTTEVVQSLGQKLDIDRVRRVRDGIRQLAQQHLAANQKTAHDSPNGGNEISTLLPSSAARPDEGTRGLEPLSCGMGTEASGSPP
jgi:hypothetical protein